MTSTAVQQWFGEEFGKLHPLLQALHSRGGKLSGVVQIQLGSGVASLLGRLIARRFSIPLTGEHQPFTVDIIHRENRLCWNRSFGENNCMQSLFIPIQTKATSGYWIEESGPVRLALTVDIVDGGWYWRCLKMWVHGMSVPRCLFPSTRAFKRIEDGRYRFFVGFAFPLVGNVLSYSGLLDAELGV